MLDMTGYNMEGHGRREILKVKNEHAERNFGFSHNVVEESELCK